MVAVMGSPVMVIQLYVVLPRSQIMAKFEEENATSRKSEKIEQYLLCLRRNKKHFKTPEMYLRRRRKSHVATGQSMLIKLRLYCQGSIPSHSPLMATCINLDKFIRVSKPRNYK